MNSRCDERKVTKALLHTRGERINARTVRSGRIARCAMDIAVLAVDRLR